MEWNCERNNNKKVIIIIIAMFWFEFLKLACVCMCGVIVRHFVFVVEAKKEKSNG